MTNNGIDDKFDEKLNELGKLQDKEFKHSDT
jgi:hypothetical protein